IMERQPEKAFRCGPQTLGYILNLQGSPSQVSQSIRDFRSTTDGVSLADLTLLSQQLGMNYRPAKRSPGAALITPSVIHWKVGHYAALMKEEDGRYLCHDTAVDNTTSYSIAAVEAEASGYFLVPPGPLPPGWSPVSAEESAKVFGKGGTA